MLKSIRFLKEDNQDLQFLIDKLRDELCSTKENKYFFSIMDVKELPVSIFYKILAFYGFNRDTTNTIFEHLEATQSGSKFYSGSHELLVDREFLIIRETKEEKEKETYLIEAEDSYLNNPIKLALEKITQVNKLSFSSDPNTAYFDFEKLSFPLLLRKWKKGDALVPFGMSGRKLISDLLTDKKVNRFDKENVWVVLSGDEIIWMAGYRSSELYKITPETKTCLKLQLLT
jgi:tRNA(Ile)-lysidine synthase